MSALFNGQTSPVDRTIVSINYCVLFVKQELLVQRGQLATLVLMVPTLVLAIRASPVLRVSQDREDFQAPLVSRDV